MTELHTIEVRYEDTDGRHVDVHDAADTESGIARALSSKDKYRTVKVYSGMCDCCDAEPKTTRYNPENVVKVEYTASDHEREGSEETDWLGRIASWLTAAFVLFMSVVILYVSSGGEIAL